ncbi:hypothetical protein FJT64_015566 [Amphibalanus amphitrite]|uniref:Secreted protein n=1 Tax=Amphibalanus amphitrite TaxID=1232801 RepID=A0A6A4X8R3_AMPAM|nr:hypothetical protein FJT64_015566 [Amphibalanus amphitrite]
MKRTLGSAQLMLLLLLPAVTLANTLADTMRSTLGGGGGGDTRRLGGGGGGGGWAAAEAAIHLRGRRSALLLLGTENRVRAVAGPRAQRRVEASAAV